MTKDSSSSIPTKGCPFSIANHNGRSNSDWWPNQLNLKILTQQSKDNNPLGQDFDYREELAKLDVVELQNDLNDLMVNSQEWWPADFGNYGPLFIRMAWHSAGTYRIFDGRGGAGHGNQRFAPLNSWPDNANLDKARRLLWPVKQKFGNSVSWADLIVFAGNCALELMGLKTIGFAFGREDIFEPQEDINWGIEETWLSNKRFNDNRVLDRPFGAVQMGLIYVNPEGPDGNPDPIEAAKDIRETFARMAMNDEETVALIAGGHTFGKFHGANESSFVGPEPEGAPIEQQGLGWKNSYKTGIGIDTYTSGVEGIWTNNPTKWDMGFFENLFKYDWVLVKSPAGAYQWQPKNIDKNYLIQDAHESTIKHPPTMLTTDLALKEDSIYGPISRHFYENPKEFELAFANAWFKLIHRDMGPKSKYVGPLVPQQEFIWQDPIPEPNYKLIGKTEIDELKNKIINSGLSISELVKTAWASASTFRQTDLRGGANGARIRLMPQIDWEVNNPIELNKVLSTLESIQSEFNKSRTDGIKVSLADLIVLGGNVGIELAANNANFEIEVPFTPGRTDANSELTDIDSIKVLEPIADGFRNYCKKGVSVPTEQLLIDRSHLLSLTIPEMTVLFGGLRVLGCNFDNSELGILTYRKGTLSSDYFVNLLDNNIVWSKSESDEDIFIGSEIAKNEVKWKATAVDLVFGSNSQLRAVAEIFASRDSSAKFINDFVATWYKVMMLDRFDLN
jgi:catalase-peroxidase